jgi:hypothetical protein
MQQRLGAAVRDDGYGSKMWGNSQRLAWLAGMEKRQPNAGIGVRSEWSN